MQITPAKRGFLMGLKGGVNMVGENGNQLGIMSQLAQQAEVDPVAMRVYASIAMGGLAGYTQEVSLTGEPYTDAVNAILYPKSKIVHGYDHTKGGRLP
ncbi:hypothetical protein HYW87_03760 [Candidatus Roizmanbacteria bacterium]|nr:hypothetical protein [Candidatus Roizmanbacteria bacterium]